MRKSIAHRRTPYVLTLTAAAMVTASYPALAQPAGNGGNKESTTATRAIETIYVYGEQGKTDTATKLNLTLFETPQTVTAISRGQMDDFALDNVSDLLNYT